MTLLQLDNLKSIVNWILLLLLTMPTSVQAKTYNDRLNISKTIDAQSLVNESTLNCNFDTSSEEIINFYKYLLESKTKKSGFNKFTIGKYYIINGVKSISRTSKKDINEISKNMDTDFKKLGVRVLRISSFIQNGEYENFGYYIILKDKPYFNKKILQKYGIEMKYSTIEETSGANTRVRCVLVG